MTFSLVGFFKGIVAGITLFVAVASMFVLYPIFLISFKLAQFSGLLNK